MREDGAFPTARGMSIERKLPLMMTAVLMTLLGAGVLLAYREIRRASEVVTADRLRDVAAGLANTTGISVTRVAVLFRNVARDEVVIRALVSPSLSPLDSMRLSMRLRSLSAPTDSGVLTELRTADGRVVASVGENERAERPPGLAVVTGPDSLTLGAFYEAAGRVYYWTTRPVSADGGRIGMLAQRRRLNFQRATNKEIERLSGPNARVIFRNADGSLWTTLSGEPMTAPLPRGRLRGMSMLEHRAPSNPERVIAFESAVARTPWFILVELPLSALSSGPRLMLKRFISISILLLLVGAIALWLVSRRITRPLKRLTAAAESIAKGDYTQHVDPRGDYEIARLGSSFNRMASEIAEAHRQLRDTAGAAAAARESAENANLSKSNFLAAMSHELRTPLNAIAGYTDLLELGLRGPLTDEQRGDIARIKRSQKYLLGLIEEILVFSQLDAQQLTFDFADVSIDSIIHDAESMVDPQFRAKGVLYRYDRCNPDLLVHADRDKTQQVLINLFVNATKYTDSGGTITVSCETRGDRVLVKVSDTGVGIPEEKLTRIFDAFVQLDRSLNKPREGVGLGLTISRDLARAMRGDLHVESTVGIGSTFTLELPLAAVAPSSENQGAAWGAETAVAR